MPNQQPIPIPIPTLGLIKSLDRERVPAEGLAEVENWIYRDGEFRTRAGTTILGNDVNERPTGFIHYDHTDGALRTVMATNTAWYSFDYGIGNWVGISGIVLTGGVEQQVFRVFHRDTPTKSYLLGTNWRDAPKKWDGLAGGSSMTGAPIARCMMILNNKIILANLKSGVNPSPVAVDWSANLNFDAGWDAQATLLADTGGEIVIAEEMGNEAGALIKTDAAYRVIAQGGSVPFRFDYVAVPRDEGAAATKACCKRGNGLLVYLALNGKLKSFDLNTVQDFGTAEARIHLQQTIELSAIGRSWMAYNSALDEIIVVYPQKGGADEPDLGLIIKGDGSIYPVRWPGRQFTAGEYIKVTKPYTWEQLPVPWESIHKTFSELNAAATQHVIIGGDLGGRAYLFSGETDQGGPIPARFESGLFNLAGGVNFQTINSIEHRYNRTVNSQTISVSIGFSKNGELRALSAPQMMNLQTAETHTTGHRVSSKYLSMRQEVLAQEPIIWKGSFINGTPRGSWR